MTVGDLLIRIGVEGSGVAAGMSKVESQMERLGTRMYFMGSRITVGFSAPIGALLASINKIGIDFDKAMTESIAIMDNVSSQMRDRMERIAVDISRTTKFAAKEAAEGYYHLASAGLDAAQAMEALPVVAQFAQAGVMNLAKSAEFLAGATAALGMRTGDATQDMQNMARVADVLTYANNKALGTIQDFAQALTNKAANQLHFFNKTVEEGTAALMAYASQNIKGRLAGQQLAMFLRDVSRYSIKNADDWKRMGVAVFDAAGKMLPIADILKQMEDRLSGASDKQRAFFFQTLGMSDRSTAATKALLGYSNAIRAWEFEAERARGTTASVAAKQMQAIGNQMVQMWHRVQNVGIKVFEPFRPVIEHDIIPALSNLIDKLDELASRFENMPDWQKKWLLIGAASAAMLGPVVMIGGAMMLAVRALAAIPTWAIGLLAGGTAARGAGGLSKALMDARLSSGLLGSLSKPRAFSALTKAVGGTEAALIMANLKAQAPKVPMIGAFAKSISRPGALESFTKAVGGESKAFTILEKMGLVAANAAPKVGLLGKAFGFLSGPIGWFLTIGPIVVDTLHEWVGSWDRVVDVLRVVAPPLAWVIDGLKALGVEIPSLTGLLGGFAKYIADTFRGLKTFWDFAYWSVGWIANKIADVGFYLRPEEIRNTIQSIGTYVKEGAQSWGEYLKGEFRNAWWNISIDAKNTWHSLGSSIQGGWDWVKQTASDFWNRWVEGWEAARNRNQSLGIWEWVKSQFAGVRLVGTDDPLGEAFQSAWRNIKSTMSGVFDWLHSEWDSYALDARSAWDSLRGSDTVMWLRSEWASFQLDIESVWDSIRYSVGGVFARIKESAQGVFDWLHSEWDSFKLDVHSLWDSTTLAGMWAGFTSEFRNKLQWAANLWRDFWAWAKGGDPTATPNPPTPSKEKGWLGKAWDVTKSGLDWARWAVWKTPEEAASQRQAMAGFTEYYLKGAQWDTMLAELQAATPRGPWDRPAGLSAEDMALAKGFGPIIPYRSEFQDMNTYAAQDIIEGDWGADTDSSKQQSRRERAIQDLMSQLGGEGGNKLDELTEAWHRLLKKNPDIAKQSDVLDRLWDAYKEFRPNLGPVQLASSEFEKLFKSEIQFGEGQQRINALIERSAKASDFFGYSLQGLGTEAKKLIAATSEMSDNTGNILWPQWEKIPKSFWEDNAEGFNQLYTTGESYGVILDALINKYVQLATTGQLWTDGISKRTEAATKVLREGVEGMSAKYQDAYDTMALYMEGFSTRDLAGVKKNLAQQAEAREDTIAKMTQSMALFYQTAANTGDQARKAQLNAEGDYWAEMVRITRTQSEAITQMERYAGLMRLAESAGISDKVLKKFRVNNIAILDSMKNLARGLTVAMGLPMNYWDKYFDDLKVAAQKATNDALEDLIKYRMEQERVYKNTKEWIDLVGNVGAFASALGFEKLGSWLTTIAGAMDAGAQSAKSFKIAVHEGNWTQAGADLMGMIGAMAKATDAVSKTQRVVGGAMSGFATGMQLSGGHPLGGLIGAGVGALVGAVRKNPTEEMIRSIGQNFPGTGKGQGVFGPGGIPEDLAAKLVETAKAKFGGNQVNAWHYELKALIDAADGLNATNFNMFAWKLRDVFILLENGSFDSAQALKVLNENFPTFAERLQKLGLVASNTFLDLIRFNSGLTETSDAINEFVRSMAKQFDTGLDKLLDFMGSKYNLNDLASDVAGATLKVATLQKNLAALRAVPGHNEDVEKQLVEDLDKAIAELDDLKAKASGVADAAATDFERVGTLMLAMFNGALKSGENLLDVLEDLGPSMTKWRSMMDAAGYSVQNPAVKTLVDLSMRVEQNPELVAGFQGLNESALALANTGSMTVEAWDSLQKIALDLVDRSQKAGFTPSQIMAMMAPFLNTAMQIPAQLGLALDPSIAQMIIQAKELGLIKDALLEQNGVLIQGFAAIIAALKGDLPDAFLKWMKEHGLVPGDDGPVYPEPRDPGGPRDPGDPGNPRDPGYPREPKYGDYEKLDTGGIVTEPTVARLAWNGRPEAVIPLDELRNNTPQAVVFNNSFVITTFDPRAMKKIVEEDVKPILDDLWRRGGSARTTTQQSLSITIPR